MRAFIRKILAPGMIWRTAAAGLLIVLGGGWLAIGIDHWIIRSRTVTQAQVARGWEAAGVTFTTHTIQHKENFWKVAKEYGSDIDSIIGANPDLKDLHAVLGQKIRVPNIKGTLHVTKEEDAVQTLSQLYDVPASAIVSVNGLKPKHIVLPGLELFIPGAKPVQLTDEMAAHYGLRGIFGSPIPGRITSNMGMRKHPVGGFRGRHTGVDLAAPEGTRIAVAAAGTIVQTGEGEYIGKFVIVAHQNSYTTLYGHCSKVLVAAGKRVKKGQIIANVGNTGRTTGPHLHFEIRKNGVPQNPLAYLW